MKNGNRLFHLFFFIFVIAFISCENSNESRQKKNDSAVPSNTENALKETNLIIEKAFYENDYETLLKYYTEDAVCSGNFQPTLRGKAAIRENYMKQKKVGVKIHSFKATADKIWENGSDVYEYGTYGLSVSSNETKHPYAFTGSYFMIWERQKDNSYLIRYLISNLDYNPCKDFY